MQAGTLLGQRYRIDGKLGEGGMGVVFKAHDTLLQRAVAIKTLTPLLLGDEGTRRFLREAQSVARLNHPHIVSIFDAIEETGTLAIVMELVEGETLRERIPLQPSRLTEIAMQVLQALVYAHEQGIIHRDIKPENIVITADGTAKLMDFGLARSEGRTRLTQTGLIVGTVAYLAPEQALGGQVDGRSDLYSLGALLYEAVTGKPPFESDDPISVITQHINVPPVAPHWLNPAIPQALENIILRLLAKDPARRYQTAHEVLTALSSIQLTGDTQSPSAEKLAGPELVERITHSPLVGRDAELGRLKKLVDQAIAGRGSVALITGPLGVGKTRLVEEAATFARLRGAVVITGKAYESAPPYEPFAKALHELARGIDSETLAARLGEFASEVVGIVPELARRLPRTESRAIGSPEDRKNRLFAGVAHFLGAMAGVNPILIFLDDMHLADAATTELLQHVARRAETNRLLLIVACRLEEIPSTPAGRLLSQVTHALSREAFCTQIALRPLSEDQVVDLIKLMANHPTPPVRFGTRIHEVTEGNPYFIEEVIKGLFERGTLYIKDGEWSTDFDDIKDYSLLELPTTAQSAVETRLRALGDQTRHVLTHAAVIGRQFAFDVLLALTELDESSLLDRVEEAIRAQLIREVRGTAEDVYEFAQPMLRQVLYESIPRRRRRLLHRQAGEAIEKLRGRKQESHPEALAYHFSEAEDLEKTLKYSRIAAKKAAAVFAYDDAVSYLHQAITAAAELDRPAEKLALMEELGDLIGRAGRREETIRAYEDALQFWKSIPGRSVIDGARLCRILGTLGTRWAMHNPRTREHISEGLRLLENQPDHPERIKLVIARAFDHYWLRGEVESDYTAAEQSALEAYSLAEKIGSLSDMSAALDALSGIYMQQADYAKSLAISQRRSAIVEQLDDPVERLDLHHVLAWELEFLGNYQDALNQIRQGLELASRTGWIPYELTFIFDAARLCSRWDRLDDAERWCRSYLEKKTATERPGQRRGIVAFLARSAAIRGRLEEARNLVEDMQAISQTIPALAWTTPWTTMLVTLELGDLEGTRAALPDGLRLADTPWAKLEISTLALRFAAQTREWQYVDQLGADALDQARRSGARHYIAADCRSLAIHRREHGRLEEAEALLLEGMDLFRAMDCRRELGLTLLELALLRRAQSRGDESIALLQEALLHFEALRAVPDAIRTRALM